MKVAIIANTAWYLSNFRLQLARRLRSRGCEVVFIARPDGYVQTLEADGFRFIPWALAGAGKNPLRESKAVLDLHRIFRSLGPTHVFSYTPKANIYSGLALSALPARFFPNVSGLGRVFIRRGLLTHIATLLYMLAFRRSEAVVFQNADDQEVFRALGVTRGRETVRVPGSGVDLARFEPSALPATQRPVRRFLFVGRLLGDKGIAEYAKAAAAIRATRQDCEFFVVGSTQSDNPAAIAPSTVDEWERQGIIRHVEHVEDIRPQLREADCVVLPSYREGMPRSLLEAAASARPVITTDVPGCRDVVIPGKTGLMCVARDAAALEGAMREMLALDIEAWTQMGLRGRAYMEQRFSEEVVLKTYEKFCQPARPA